MQTCTHTRRILAILGLLAGAGAAQGADQYDPSSGRLTMAALTVGGATLSNVVVSIGNVVQSPAGTSANGSVDTYDPSLGQLTVPAVVVSGHTYYNVVATVKDLISVGGVAGGDTYDGAHLAIPAVTLGSAGGGLPLHALDQYDPDTGQLTVAVATDLVHGKVYTNAIVKPGRIVSVGGAGSASQYVTEHVLAETALSFGLGWTLLQSQLLVVAGLSGQLLGCGVLKNGGSFEAGPGTTPTTVTVYYDNACTQPYIVANGSLAQTPTMDSVAETATYYGLSGSVIGTLTLNESLDSVTGSGGATSINLHGLGTFTPATGVRTPVQLGLYCNIPSNIATANSYLSCGTGVVQDFPALGLAIGAVTPMTLSVGSLNSGGFTEIILDSSSTVFSGPLGSLSLTAPGALSLVVTGYTRSVTNYFVNGNAAAFSLFPPTPTSWSVTDPLTGMEAYAIQTGDAARDVTLDRSGSGLITWSDGSVAPITGWTLGVADRP